MIEDGKRSLVAFMNHKIETVVPKGWKTAQDIAAETGYSLSQTGQLIRRACKAGALEMRKFKVSFGGTMRTIQHYKEILK